MAVLCTRSIRLVPPKYGQTGKNYVLQETNLAAADNFADKLVVLREKREMTYRTGQDL